MNTIPERSKSANTSSGINRKKNYPMTKLKNKLREIPFFGTMIVKMYCWFSMVIKNVTFRLRKWISQFTHSFIKVENIYYISPKSIVYSSFIEYNYKEGKGLIKSGDWDLLEKKFEELDIYIAIREVINEHKKWEDTIYYQRTIKKILLGETLWGCKTKEDFDRRCKQIDQLIEKISKDGYKSQKELLSGNPDDEIIINIGRFGDLLFSNSAHRLAIAKILDIQTIPVKIAVRHSEWMRFRNQYEKLAVERDKKAYQPALHPDLQYIPSHHDCLDRYQIIKKNISCTHGNLLDLGSNLGYFSSKFEDDGFTCVAVENDPRYIFCLKGLKRATNKKFKIIEGSLLDNKEILNGSYDIVLALNIFHHFLKTEELFQKFESFLEHLVCKEIIFEPHLYDEPQMKNAYCNMPPYEFCEFISKKSNLKKIDLIGHASDERLIYKISWN